MNLVYLEVDAMTHRKARTCHYEVHLLDLEEYLLLELSQKEPELPKAKLSHSHAHEVVVQPWLVSNLETILIIYLSVNIMHSEMSHSI